MAGYFILKAGALKGYPWATDRNSKVNNYAEITHILTILRGI